ncbi:MAG: LacI family DNA-binding transcriptional regulator [Methanocella sp.]
MASVREASPRPPTLKDVAETAGVSVATVSNVLNPDASKFVSAALRERVQAAAQALNYRPNVLARGMRGKGRRALAILVPQFENFFFTRLVIGAERVAHAQGYVLLICATYDEPSRERFYIERLLSQKVDGFLLSPTAAGAANTCLLREGKIPYVVVDRQLPGFSEEYDFVGFSNRQAADLATEYLIAHGHRRIGFIGWNTGLPVLDERKDGFLDAVARHGLDPKDAPILLGPHTREEGERLLERLLAEHDVSAVFAGHQYQAEGVVLALRKLGKRVPKDLSLVVYGRPPWTELADPPPVCVEMPDSELGERAVRRLVERIEGRTVGYLHDWVAPSLSPGASVATVSGPKLQATRRRKATA